MGSDARAFLQAVCDLVPREDRDLEARVFGDLTDARLRTAWKGVPGDRSAAVLAARRSASSRQLVAHGRRPRRPGRRVARLTPPSSTCAPTRTSCSTGGRSTSRNCSLTPTASFVATRSCSRELRRDLPHALRDAHGCSFGPGAPRICKCSARASRRVPLSCLTSPPVIVKHCARRVLSTPTVHL